MKRFWLSAVPLLLVLAFPARAQEGASPKRPASRPAPAPAAQGGMYGTPTAESDAAASSEAPAPDAAPVAEPNSSESQPFISVKVATPPEEEGEESVAPAESAAKVTPTATIGKTPKQAKSAPKGAKSAMGKKGALSGVQTRAPIVIAAAPPPLPIPAVPLTPITPRNP